MKKSNDNQNLFFFLFALIFLVVLCVSVSGCSHKETENKPAQVIYSGDYQLDTDQDSIYLSDRGIKIGAVPLDTNTAIGKLIVNDNQ